MKNAVGYGKLPKIYGFPLITNNVLYPYNIRKVEIL
jgi:hypothetical protein